MPPIQYVTLVAAAGTPIRLADQTGAPYPTTGEGSLVFGDNPTLNNPEIIGPVWVGPDTFVSPTLTGTPLFNVGSSTTNGVILTSSASRATGDELYGLTINTSGLGGGLSVQQTFTGTPNLSLPLIGNFFKVLSDNVDAGSGAFHVNSFDLYHGGSSAKGGRAALIGNYFLTSATSATNANRNYTATAGAAFAQSDDGGSGTTLGTAKGQLFGGGFTGVLETGAVNFLNVTAAEFGTTIETGASAHYRSGIQVVDLDSQVAGAEFDGAVSIGATGAPVGWTAGILFSDVHGARPINESGYLVRTIGAHTVAYGLDISSYTITNAAFKSPGFEVGGAGSLKMLQANAGAFAAGEWSRDAQWGTFYKAPTTGASADFGIFDATSYNGILAHATAVSLTYGTASRLIGLSVDTAGNIVSGSGASLTTATDGFLYVPSCPGTPTGVPTVKTGRIPIVVDSSNNKLYFYSGGAWRDAGP